MIFRPDIRTFLDTNILLYGASDSIGDVGKTQVAQHLLSQTGNHISIQVLNEFTVNAMKPNKLGFSVSQVAEWIEQWGNFHIHDLVMATHLGARELCERYRLNPWDSQILASAIDAKCDVLFSEDFHDGQKYGDIEVINPFK